MDTATAKPEKETTVYQPDFVVTEKFVSTATAESESQQDTTDFMTAQLFHDFVYPGEDYASWLSKTAESNPENVRILCDEGAARISLIRAKQFAFQTQTDTGTTALKLITAALSRACPKTAIFWKSPWQVFK